MSHKSKTCFRKDGTPLTAYADEFEAQHAADRMLELHGRAFVSYRCRRCSDWHLAPNDRQTPCKPCPHCTDSRGRPKKSYETEAGAERRAEIELEERGAHLRVYRCPDGRGWHLTKRMWSL